jgi:hypothetical protein
MVRSAVCSKAESNVTECAERCMERTIGTRGSIGREGLSEVFATASSGAPKGNLDGTVMTPPTWHHHVEEQLQIDHACLREAIMTLRRLQTIS